MGLGRINIHAGSFKKGLEHQYVRGQLIMKNEGKFFREKISITEVESLELATEESIISVGGAAGWGTAGAILLGPVGLLAGLMLGGKRNDTTFICKFKDGRSFLGTIPTNDYNQMNTALLALSFSSKK